MIQKAFILFIFISNILQASTTLKENIPQIVLDAIKNTECLKKNDIQIPNFIRINRKRDVEIAKKNNINVKKHIIICNEPKKCSDKVKNLLSLGIKNIDLGPYQINYHYQGHRWDDNGDYSKYFKTSTAEQRARTILSELISKFGYSWQTLGRYHHFDISNQKRNILYYSKLYKYIYGSEPYIASTYKGRK